MWIRSQARRIATHPDHRLAGSDTSSTQNPATPPDGPLCRVGQRSPSSDNREEPQDPTRGDNGKATVTRTNPHNGMPLPGVHSRVGTRDGVRL
jgi:hypothetical protein